MENDTGDTAIDSDAYLPALQQVTPSKIGYVYFFISIKKIILCTRKLVSHFRVDAVAHTEPIGTTSTNSSESGPESAKSTRAGAKVSLVWGKLKETPKKNLSKQTDSSINKHDDRICSGKPSYNFEEKIDDPIVQGRKRLAAPVSLKEQSSKSKMRNVQGKVEIAKTPARKCAVDKIDATPTPKRRKVTFTDTP